MEPGIVYYITLIFLFLGLLLLLAGHLLRNKKSSHLILVVGWVLFGIFWLTQIPHFMAIRDSFNAILCFLGFVLFLYFSYHEILNFRWDENVYSLNYIAGVAAVAGLVYYLIERIEPLAKALIYIVALKSVWLTQLFGMDISLGEFGRDPLTNELSLVLNGSDIGIILACTGIQSIAIFLGIFIVTKSDRNLWLPWAKKFLKKPIPKEVKNSPFRNWLWRKKKVRLKKVVKMPDKERFFRAFIYTIPVIYVLNIFRNSLIIWGVEHEVLGPKMVTFDIAHNYLSKILSLAVLIILLFIVFELLPECLEGIMGLLDLPKRNRKGVVKDGFIQVEEQEESNDKKEESHAKEEIKTTKKVSKNKSR